MAKSAPASSAASSVPSAPPAAQAQAPEAAPPRAIRAWLDSLVSGIVEFERDWPAGASPVLVLSPGAPALSEVRIAPGLTAAKSLRYFIASPGVLAIVLPLTGGSQIDPVRDSVYVAGDFNGWQEAVGRPEWLMHLAQLDGERVLQWTGPADRVLKPGGQRFKFVTGEHIWLFVPGDAPNAVRDEGGMVNRLADPTRTGAHLWRFTLAEPIDLAGTWAISAGVAAGDPALPLGPGGFFYNLASDLPMGATVGPRSTTFRLFAPRASAVVLHACRELSARADALAFPLARRADADGTAGVWEVELDQNLQGWYYWYSVDGAREGEGRFDPAFAVLDPYALATVDRDGPGIVLDRRKLAAPDDGFATPAWQDLVIVEAHVRDLTAQAPIEVTPAERRGFTGLRRWVESPNFYLHELGVNCVELQPVQEFDNVKPEDYHWGYMTNNYFAPESSYALAPEQASGVAELQALVAAFHRRGLAVILDVVYNHVGEPAHLMFIDRVYYFEHDAAGKPANFSGCGNDVRANSAMARRLIIDSLIHLVTTYRVDGFRFDLAELLGVEVLVAIEAALKRVKPDLILIAEPWSFRGHIAGALRDTGWASWNDGYRTALRDYVRGGAPAERMEYFIRGSPWYFAKWPAQTVNYVESHDDMTFLDAITENADHDGFAPTPHDIARTHLMAAVLFMSIGIPMISAGQDFLRSKHGVNNTYLRGDLNALDYHRIYRHRRTHAYFADWIAFRRGDSGRLLRQYSRPTEGFFQFFRSGDAPPLAVIYNADQSQGRQRLLFAVNPTLEDAVLPLGDAAVAFGPWTQVADHDRFLHPGSRGARHPVEADLRLPALTCGLWSAPGGLRA
jgi:pullulanase/glycogen debranching enzyme